MSDVVIDVENLSKQYQIGQLVSARRFARALRDRSRLGKYTNGSNGNDADDPNIIWALRDINFQVRQGEVLGIIGHNGSGKSTLLKILSRITAPSGGRAMIEGRIGSLLEVGTGFHPELTGRENIFLNGSILGMRRVEIQKKFDEIVAFSGVSKFLDTPVKRYSSGMRVRLGFSVAAHLDPEVLMIDEVLAVGDVSFQKQCLDKISQLAKHDGRTVLFVSHQMMNITTLAGHCIWLDHGEVRASGSTMQVAEKYLEVMSERGGVSHVVDAERLRPDHGTKIRICSIQPVYQGAGFNQGDDLLFDIAVRSSISQDGLAVGFGVGDSTGAPILSTFSANDLNVKKDRESKWRLRITDARLTAGTYVSAVSIVGGGYDEPIYSFDVVKPGPRFVVSPLRSDGSIESHWKAPAYGRIVHPQSHLDLLDSDVEG